MSRRVITKADREAMATSVHDSLRYICRTYGVPAALKGRVLYTWRGANRLGTIVGTSGAHLMIRLDGERRPAPFHPNWELRYLIEVDRRTDRHGETWTRTANRKPWRGMGGVGLSEAELAERGPLTDTSYVITTWPTAQGGPDSAPNPAVDRG
jgi:hypothetical protein